MGIDGLKVSHEEKKIKNIANGNLYLKIGIHIF